MLVYAQEMARTSYPVGRNERPAPVDAAIFPGDLVTTFRLRVAGDFLDHNGTTSGSSQAEALGDGFIRDSCPSDEPGILGAGYLSASSQLPHTHAMFIVAVCVSH